MPAFARPTETSFFRFAHLDLVRSCEHTSDPYVSEGRRFTCRHNFHPRLAGFVHLPAASVSEETVPLA